MTARPDDRGSDHPMCPEGAPTLQILAPWNALDQDRVDVFHLFRVLRKRWRVVAGVTGLGTVLGIAYALLATPVYRAEATIAAPREGRPGASAAALTAIGGIGTELISNLGISLTGADAGRLEALLRSHRLIRRVITDHNLLPVLFADEWDHEKGQWKALHAEDIPDVWDFMEEIDSVYRVKNDTRAGVIRVSFDHEDPSEATKVLEYVLDDLARLVQQDEIDKIDKNIRFAESQLQSATDPVVISKLQSLLSDQIEKAMLAQNARTFAYDLIDPPAASDKKVSPRRRIVTLLSMSGSLLLGTIAALLCEAFDKASEKGDAPS